MKKFFFLLCCVTLIVSSCKDPMTVQFDNASHGQAAEVLLMMDKQTWAENIQDSIKGMLTVPQTGLNQLEPMFDILHINPKDIDAAAQRHYNIVQMELSGNAKETSFSIERNTWAMPQIIITIKGNNQDSCLNCFVKNQETIRQELYSNDIKKLQGVYEDRVDMNLQKLIQEKFGITMNITSDYSIAREEDDFLWLGYRTAVNDRFVMIYKSDNKNLSRQSVINQRNLMTRKYIEGSTDAVHPIVTQFANMPYAQPLQLGPNIGLELRGIWETENDFMGGPFYHFSFLNTQNECISVDGFVYAPNEKKRNYLRQVEAIVKSTK